MLETLPNLGFDFKNFVIKCLQKLHGLSLILTKDDYTLFTNHVNLSNNGLATLLYDLRVSKYRVLIFGMKWKIMMAEHKIDHYIN